MEPLSFTYYESIDKQECSNSFSLLYKTVQKSIQDNNNDYGVHFACCQTIQTLKF